MKYHRFIIKYFILIVLFFPLIPVQAQLTQKDIQELKQQAITNGWTFDIGETSATQRNIKELTGYVPPDPQLLDELGYTPKPIVPTEKLPSRWDWREKIPGGLPPIRDQGSSCGSCWAFATVGVLECAIKIKDGINVDLSEQWLVDCATGWLWYGCDGGTSAHDWHKGTKTDSCGGYGAVFESDYPYTGYGGTCNCPKPHHYTINDWHYVGSALGIPSIDALKTAIYRYGPITSAMVAPKSLLAYKGGIYNDNTESKETVDHMIVIVGWDDDYGNGAFIIRNSWGEYWGENGYGYIEYGTAQIGYGADYIEYGNPSDPLLITPQQNLFFYLSSNNFISPTSIAIQLENTSEYNINWSSTTDEGIALNPTFGTISPGETVALQLTVTQQPTQPGTYTKSFSITNNSTQNIQSFNVKLKKAYPAPISFSFNTDPNWEKTGNWAFGQPTGLDDDPTSGHTGQYVYGYNLNGAYENDMGEEVLITSPIDCSQIKNVTFSFYRWLGVESSEYDNARIDVSTNGTTWTTIWEHTEDSFQDTSWSLQSFNLSSIADRQPLLLIRWVMGPTDYSETYSGWNIDDVSITGNPINVSVPNVVGKAIQQALADITAAGLTQGNTTGECSNSVPKDYIISQSPQAGALVSPGTKVNLTVSTGPCPIIVPDLIGLTYEEAESQISSLGLSIGEEEFLCNNEVPENTVIDQNPSPQTEVLPGTSINLTLSLGLCPQEGSSDGEGAVEGNIEGHNEGVAEGSPEGVTEGITEGAIEGITEGTTEGANEGTQEGLNEGTNEGFTEGTQDGTIEGISEGITEGPLEGTDEGLPEGPVEGSTEGIIEGNQDGLNEGQIEGTIEGITEGITEGTIEGVIEGATEGTTEGEIVSPFHSTDIDKDGKINLEELLRTIQFFNSGGYHCESGTEDGYSPGLSMDTNCRPHSADYAPQNWIINLSELLRVIQYFNMDGYYSCPGLSEDNYCPSPLPLKD